MCNPNSDLYNLSFIFSESFTPEAFIKYLKRLTFPYRLVESMKNG